MVVEGGEAFVHFTVDGVEVGDELDVLAGAAVDLTATLILPAGVRRIGTLKIVKNSEVIAFKNYNQVGGSVDLVVSDMPSASAWYSARIEKSHAGVVYVQVDGQPIAASVASAQYFINYLNYLRNAIVGGTFYQLTPEDQIALLADLDAAQSTYVYIRDLAAGAVSVAQVELGAPAAPRIRMQPNPFGRSVRVELDGAVGPLVVDIFSADGRQLRRFESSGPAARSAIVWDGRDAAGHQVPSGTYFYRVHARGRTLDAGSVVRVR